MSFFGVFGEGRARALAESRAIYLCSPVLHYSLDGLITLVYGKRDESVSAARYPYIFAATSPQSPEFSVSTQTVSRLYFRYGKHFGKHLAYPMAYALYDSRRATLYLGGTCGEKCYLEAWDNAILFSSDPHLLRAPVAVDHLILVKKKEAH